METVKSSAKFKQFKTSKKGFFIITDSANPPKLHDVTCNYVRIGNFKTKVLENRNQNGEYFWVEDWDSNHPYLDEQPCKMCLN
jgi:hypothetical protein